MNAYLRIKEYNDSYTATEKLIAEYILENDILQDSAQALGEKTNTSAAAIIHFSKKIGFKGFSDLKMNLAQSTKEEEKQEVDLIFEPEDNISTLVEKGCRLNMNTVLKTYQLINIDILEESIDSKFIYDKRATLRATLSSIKQTNHLIMGKNSTSFYSISLVTNPFFTGFYTFTAFLPVLSHVWPTLHVLSSNYIPSWPDNC